MMRAPSVPDSETRLTALDAAIARGLANAEAGLTQPAKAVFARLKRRYRDMPKPEG